VSAVERMSAVDAGFLDAEDEDRHVSMAIASVAIFEGPAPSHAEFLAMIAGRLPLIPRYRQKAREVPFDLGRPVWVDDPHFDLRYHIRRTALPAPGGDEQLCRLMARVMSQRLDRERPLWECWVIENLAGGRWALILKVHHCMVDGVSGVSLYYVLMDGSPEPSAGAEDYWQPGREPSALRLTVEAVRDLALNPVEQLRALAAALHSPVQLARRGVETVRGLTALAAALRPADASSLSGPIGQHRRYGLVRASLADVAAVRKRFGGTVNDVVLAAVSGGFREVLLARGEQPVPHVLRSLVPVSVRAKGEEGIFENRISIMLVFLPVDIADPLERLTAVRRHLAAAKASKEAEAGEAMTSLAQYEPFPPVSLGIRLVSRLPQRQIITVTTNVPGPPTPLYLAGHRLLEVFPYVPIATTLRFGVSIFTYCDRLTLGITGDYDTAPDIDVLARGIEDALAELAAAARESSPPGRGAGDSSREAADFSAGTDLRVQASRPVKRTRADRG
jgi:WS/DGAT/MGAT family acyltransferase